MNHYRSSKTDRESFFAGKFYPGNKKELLQELKKLIAVAEDPCSKNDPPQAIVSPHAGYVFSGEVAASAFNQIPVKAEYKRVFVIASSHQMAFKGAAVYCPGNYKTPLGTINVDTDLAIKLCQENSLFVDNDEAHRNEHSLEVQLPFLQYKLGSDFLLVPIILGTQSAEECKKIAEVLAPYFVPENLFVISTDLSHYPEYNDAVEVDKRTADAVLSNNPQNLLQTIEKNRQLKIPHLATSMCGWTSVLMLMYLTENKRFEYKKIASQNSGDARFYGDKSRVVGYLALAVYQKPEDNPFVLLEEEKNNLLKLARQSLMHSYGLAEEKVNPTIQSQGILNEKLGIFVSLYLESDLRGCIGNIEGYKPLFKSVPKIVVSASNDYRFDKLKPEDIKNVTIELSVLSPLKKIEDVQNIKLGKHGIVIKRGFSSGTFLPQVATKTDWNLEQFLGHCSRDKAGIGWDGWKTAEIYTYEAIIFSDKNREDII